MHSSAFVGLFKTIYLFKAEFGIRTKKKNGMAANFIVLGY
jgi:hypothetical protein